MNLLLVLLLGFSANIFAQEMSFMSPAATDRVSLSLEHQDMSAIEEQKASFSIPLYDGTESGLAFTAKGQRTLLSDRLRFPTAGVDIPEEFGSADFGFSWKNEDLAGNKLGFSASYGNAGTRLFSGDSNGIISATVFSERKKLDHSWMYFLSYSNNRTILNNIPIPGIAYAMNGKSYSAIFGLPFVFINWRPDPWGFSGMISPFGAMVESSFRAVGPLQIYVNTNWSPRAYQNLVKGSDKRLIFDKKEAGGGLRLSLGRMASFSAGYVYDFDRRFLLGESLNDEDAESISMEDSSGFQVKVRVSF